LRLNETEQPFWQAEKLLKISNRVLGGGQAKRPATFVLFVNDVV
jgi:hypothetical protein